MINCNEWLECCCCLVLRHGIRLYFTLELNQYCHRLVSHGSAFHEKTGDCIATRSLNDNVALYLSFQPQIDLQAHMLI
eukprot:g21472.t1